MRLPSRKVFCDFPAEQCFAWSAADHSRRFPQFSDESGLPAATDIRRQRLGTRHGLATLVF
jgi:hypothetical protein